MYAALHVRFPHLYIWSLRSHGVSIYARTRTLWMYSASRDDAFLTRAGTDKRIEKYAESLSTVVIEWSRFRVDETRRNLPAIMCTLPPMFGLYLCIPGRVQAAYHKQQQHGLI